MPSFRSPVSGLRNSSLLSIRVIRGLLFLLLIVPRLGLALTPPETLAPGPDPIVGDLPSLIQAGSDGTQVGLMMATDVCNNGNVQLNWFQLPETDHPVIPQNLYRLSGGTSNDERFEQIGQSWVKHAVIPLQQNSCGFGCTASPDSAHLGAGCSTADSANFNANQNGLGSRAWVNPFTGAFPSNSNNHAGHAHDGPEHRILVEANDLNTTMNPGATYFGEAQLVSPQEYAWCAAHTGQCNMYNNVSYRQFAVAGTTTFNFSGVGNTVRMTPALFAWPGATIQTIEPAQGVDGKAFLAYKVTQIGEFLWHYEYAIYNENLDRGIAFFSAPAGCGIGSATNPGFHAPLNPPGLVSDGTVGNAGYSNAPWTLHLAGSSLSWSTETFAQNPNANAIRWGTLYNFRFDGGAPMNGTGTIGFFKTADFVTVSVPGPIPECAPSPSPPPPPTPTATPTATPPASPSPTATPFSTPSPMPCKNAAENFDSVTAPALPPGWASSFWVTETNKPDTAPNDAFVSAPVVVSDRTLDTFLLVNSFAPSVAFKNRYSLDSGGGEFFDGGVLEISSPNINGGAFTDVTDPAVGGEFVVGGYTATISNDFGNPLGGRRAWSGFSAGYVSSLLHLGPQLIGQTIVLRFRLGTDTGGDTDGRWRIDTISFSGMCMTFAPPPSPTATPSPTPTPTPPFPPACAWTAAAVYPIPILREAVTTLDGNIYSFGGRSNGNYVSNSYKFDGTSWTSIAPLPVAQGGSMATNDGTYIYILGGEDISDRPFNTMYRYNPATNTYTTLTPFFIEVTDGVAVCLGGNIFKMMGDTISASSNAVEIYNIATGTWTFGQGNPFDGRAGFASAFVQGNYIYIAGGRFLGNTDATTKTYRYDTATDTWSDDAIADLPQSRWAAASAFYNNGGVLAGGYIAHGPFHQVPTASAISWDPISNAWITLPDMLGERASFSGTVLGGSFHVVGGGSFASPSSGTNDNQKLTCSPTPRPTVTPTATPSATATPSPTPTPTPTPNPDVHAVNLSTRMRVQTGDNVGIGGFIITGAPKNVLIRAIGPSLAGFGIPNVLADPVLELHGPNTFGLTNNNWRDWQEKEIQATGIPPTNDLESAIVAELSPGPYTAVVSGNNDTAGVALIEVYDLDQTNINSSLANLSTRAFVSTGDNVVIAGFILGGPPQAAGDRIIVRGIGPSLTGGGVPNPLADPTLELRDANGALLLANNDWQDDPEQAAQISAAFLAPTNNLEAAIFATLPPAIYTAVLAGLNDGAGLGLVEVYNLGPP